MSETAGDIRCQILTLVEKKYGVANLFAIPSFPITWLPVFDDDDSSIDDLKKLLEAISSEMEKQ